MRRVDLHSTPRALPTEEHTENRKKFHVHEYGYDELRATLESVFARAVIFSQIDEIIATHHPRCAWNFVALCVP